MIKIQNQSEEIESINPRMTLEEQEEITHVFDVEETLAEGSESYNDEEFDTRRDNESNI